MRPKNDPEPPSTYVTMVDMSTSYVEISAYRLHKIIIVCGSSIDAGEAYLTAKSNPCNQYVRVGYERPRHFIRSKYKKGIRCYAHDNQWISIIEKNTPEYKEWENVCKNNESGGVAQDISIIWRRKRN